MPPILPVGTQVVALHDVRAIDGGIAHVRGSLGTIVASPVDPTHSYRVRFSDGAEASFRRSDLSVLAQFQQAASPDASGLADRMAEHGLWEHVILKVVVGSRAYGLHSESSDFDRRGVYLPPADRLWSLYGVPEQLENETTQETYWELQKFIALCLKANPGVLEVLYSPLVEHATPLAQELIAMRAKFLSKLVYQTYSGYVMSQFRKLQGDLRNQGQVKWKHVMHLIRLLISGVTALREGVVPVDAGEHRERLLAIKHGEVAWDGVEQWRLRLHAELDEAYRTTTLPDRPDYAAANAFLLKARRSALG